MQRIVRACAVGMLLWSSIAGAQQEIPSRTLRPAEEQPMAQTQPAYAISFGGYLAAKGGINTVPAQGRKSDLNINPLPDLGLSFFIPFQAGGTIGVGFDIGYATYSYANKPSQYVSDNNTIIERYSYLNLFPHLNLKGFVIGLNIGLLPSGRARTKSDRDASVVVDSDSPEISSDKLQTLLELRLGANVPIWENPLGHLNLYVMGGYALNGLYANYRDYLYSRDNGVVPSADKNPRPASVALGLAYYFRILTR